MLEAIPPRRTVLKKEGSVEMINRGTKGFIAFCATQQLLSNVYLMSRWDVPKYDANVSLSIWANLLVAVVLVAVAAIVLLASENGKERDHYVGIAYLALGGLITAVAELFIITAEAFLPATPFALVFGCGCFIYGALKTVWAFGLDYRVTRRSRPIKYTRIS